MVLDGIVPWFVRKSGDSFCVVKGTKEQPGETVKCHATPDKANAHMRALYANTQEELAKKKKMKWKY